MPVWFHSSGERLLSDICIVARGRIAPRKSFVPFFNRFAVREGDWLRLVRNGSRDYEVHFIASIASQPSSERRCNVCGSPAIPGDDMCFAHHSR
jgi:hypothetical protein